MGKSIEAEIASVAWRQEGNITREQLLMIGLEPSAIAHRCRAGRLYRVYPGVSAVGSDGVT